METSQLRFDDPKHGKRLVTAGYIGYLVAFLFACLIGSQGPKPFTTNGAGETFNSTIRSGSTHSENRVSQLEGLSPANQFIIVECPIKNTLWQTYGETFEYDLDVMVTARAYRDTAAVRENEYVTLENELEFTRTVRCEAKEPWCNDIIIFVENSVDFAEYTMDVTFYDPGQKCRVLPEDECKTGESDFVYRMHMHTVSHKYTDFEVMWKYFFVVATLVVLFAPYEGYLRKLRRLPAANWSTQQRWILLLAWGLVLFNDPFIAGRIYGTDGAATSGLATFAVICLSFELSAIMCFWLCLFSDIWASGQRNRMEGSMRPITVGLDVGSSSGPDPLLFRQWRSWGVMKRGVSNMQNGNVHTAYWPKVLLCALIWIIMACTYTYVQIRTTANPTWTPEDSNMGDDFENLKTTLMVLVGFYNLWLCYLMYKSFCYARSLPKHYIFVLVITLFSIVLTAVGIYAQAYFLRGQSIVFIVFNTMVNVYVWTLMFVYAPRNPGENGVDNMNHVPMPDDLATGSEWDTATDELDGEAGL